MPNYRQLLDQTALKAKLPPGRAVSYAMAPSFGMKGIQTKISNHFEEKGFNANQIAKAIFIHELLGIAILGTTLMKTVCDEDAQLIFKFQIDTILQKISYLT